MKRFLSIMFFLGLVMTMQSQSFCLKLSEVSNDGTNYVVKVEMQGDVAFNLGSSNLQFSYEDASLGTPSLMASPLAPPFYFVPTITTPNSGQASLNIELGFPNTGLTVPAMPGYFELATITFPIINAEAIGGMAWSYNGGTTETVVFLEDEATQMFAASTECLLGIEAPVTGPENDLCAGALAIACGESATASTLEANADANIAGCGTPVNTAPGIWYTMAGTGLEITVNTNGSSYDTKMGVYSGACDDLTCISTDDDGGNGLQSQVTFSSEAATTYYIYVTGFNTAAGDIILNASCLTEAEGCIDAAACNFNSAAGVDDGSCVFAEGCDICSGETDGTGTVIDNPEVGTACDDGNPATSNDVIGTNCVCSGSAGNQTCADAEAIGEGFFTAANPNGGSGASLVCQGTNGTAGTNAVWYAYTASFTGDALISSCLGGQDTRVSVFAGTCDALGDCIASDDDTCPFATDGTGSSFAAEVLLPVTSGQTYLVEWDDRWTDGGFDFSITNATVEPILGCTDIEACNYDEFAETDDESCVFAEGCDACNEDGSVDDNPEIGDACDDGDDLTIFDMYVDCGLCVGTLDICFDPNACNYNELPTGVSATANESRGIVGGGSCIYAFGCDECSGEIDGTGIVIDNPEIGDDCDDGNENTENDVFIACDLCEGTPIIDAPENDLCEGALNIACGETATGSTTTASIDGSLAGCGISVTTAPGVWYSFLGNGAEMTINTNGSNYDTKLGIYGGACDALICIETDDDDGAGLQSQVVFDSELGVTYYAYVTGFSANNGDYALNIICAEDVLGCTNIDACNYNPDANVDDESCILATGCDVCDGEGGIIDNPEIGDACDDGDDNTENDVLIACDICEGTPIIEIFGCTDAEACNYDANATTDDGSCTYGLFYIPIDFTASGSEPAVQACEAPEGYVLGDQDCLIAIILDDSFCIEVDWDQICEDDYQECLGINDCQAIESSMWGEGPWMNGGTQYTFVAENANDAILAQGEGDVSIEVFDGECGGASLGVFNNYGAGQIERAVPGNLIIGNTYSYFVTTAGSPESVMSKVKKYAVTLIEAEYCNSTMELIDQIYCSREEDMYNNPAVNVVGYSFKFVHQVTGDEIIITDLSMDGFYQQLTTITGFELGATYDVSASHQVIQHANGSIQSLFSDYGPSCPITIETLVPLTNVKDQYCGGESTFSLSDMIKAEKVTGADQYEWIFDNGSEQITHQTVGYPLLLWQVPGLEYGSAYTITVRAHLNGNWGAFGSSCTILMDSQPTGTKVRDTHCGLDYLIPSSQLLFADVVFAASEYTWEFNDGVSIQEFTSVNYKLLLNSTGISTGFYDVRVKAFAGGVYGDYAMSCEISINGGGPGIINDEADLAAKSFEPTLEATIYPNPNSGDNVSLNLTNLSDDSKKVIVEVMDLFGKKVYSEQMASNGSTFQYELRFNQNLPTGLYLVHILVDGKTVTEKLVVE